MKQKMMRSCLLSVEINVWKEQGRKQPANGLVLEPMEG